MEKTFTGKLINDSTPFAISEASKSSALTEKYAI